MMTRFAMATAAVLLGGGSAYAQARMNVSPLPALGRTSPLGIPNAPVGQTGIPLGATELDCAEQCLIPILDQSELTI